MDSKSMTRKDFFVLTFSLVGSAVVASNCGSSSGGGGMGGATGTGGKGTGGGTGTGGRGAGGGPGTGGSGTGGSGTGGRDGGGDTGPGDTGPGDVPVNNDSGPTDTANSCELPLSEEQRVVVAGAGGDTNSHTHTVTVNGATLSATTPQTIQTSLAGNNGGHMHDVTFSAADLATLRGGGMVTVRSSNFGATDGGADAGSGAAGHTHSYLVSCHPLPDAGNDSGPGDATAG